jgi:hypothetical protein
VSIEFPILEVAKFSPFSEFAQVSGSKEFSHVLRVSHGYFDVRFLCRQGCVRTLFPAGV